MAFLLLCAGAVAVAFGVTVIATPLVRRLALRRAWTDAPDDHRKFHRRTTPSMGGTAIFAGVAAATTVIAFVGPRLGLGDLPLPALVIVGGAVMVLLGAVDDARGLDFKVKLGVEVLVAYSLLHAGLRIDLSALPFVGEDVFLDALYSIPLTVLWVVGVMNAVNLIDGVDGLASGVVAIAFASLALAYGLAGDFPLVVLASVFVGALAGFLVHNFNPATIFMGDSGSLFLGYSLAVYTLTGPTHPDPVVAPVLPLLALGLPLLDTSLSMARRIAERRAISAPDHDHIHHRMSGRMSTSRAVVALYGISAIFGVLAVLANAAEEMGALVAVGCAIAVAAGLLFRLGYVRLPYATPSLRPIKGMDREADWVGRGGSPPEGPPTHPPSQPAAETESDGQRGEEPVYSVRNPLA